MFQNLKSKYTGCMLGVAIGDALGKQNEGLFRSEILKKGYVTDYGKAPKGCPAELLKSGQYTDDTEQTLILAQSLIECKGFDGADFAQRIAEWGASTLADPVRKSFIGPSSYIAVNRLNSGISWKESGSDFPSCGSSMRAAPIGLYYKKLDQIESNAVLSSIPTHNNQSSKAGAVAVAIAVRCALLEMECSEIIEEASYRASNYDPDLGKKIEIAFKEKDLQPDYVFSKLGISNLASDTVPGAFYSFSKHFDNFENAIIESVNAGGDTDSIACITGALCGAFHGIESIPKKWILGLENRELVEQVADLILKASQY
jgi:ADP-ribosylglycohydrolase